MSTSPTVWAQTLYSDFSAAAVRATTVMGPTGQHLLFGCVELFPHEIPAPPVGIQPIKKRFADATLVSVITTMPVSAALTWYTSALAGQLRVPGISKEVKVETLQLAPEPALGRFVLGRELPFEARWHCGARLHHLVPLGDPPQDLAWLAPTSKSPHRAGAREWLADALGFDLLAYDEFLFSLVLLVPNPIVRSFSSFIYGALPGGGEKLGVSIRARRGASLKEVAIRFREERPEGTSTVIDCSPNELGTFEIDLPEQCSRAGIELLSVRHGILATEAPARFFRSFSVCTDIVAPKGTIDVPPRKKGGVFTRYPLHAREGTRSQAAAKEVQAAEARLVELQARRLTRVVADRPDGLWHDSAGEERLLTGRRAETVFFIRALVAQARNLVVFVDPYFDRIDIREFASAIQFSDVEVYALIGRESLWNTNADDETRSIAGDVLAEDLRLLAEAFKTAGYPVPDVRLMGDQARSYHDRFLIVDESVWHFGHSFNRAGADSGEISMATRLRYPDEIRSIILEDIDRAAVFLDVWSNLNAARRPKQMMLCERMTSWIRQAWGWSRALAHQVRTSRRRPTV